MISTMAVREFRRRMEGESRSSGLIRSYRSICMRTIAPMSFNNRTPLTVSVVDDD